LIPIRGRDFSLRHSWVETRSASWPLVTGEKWPDLVKNVWSFTSTALARLLVVMLFAFTVVMKLKPLVTLFSAGGIEV
jgi:hypothetical protein